MSPYEQLWLAAFIKTQVIEVSLGLITLYLLHTRSPSTSTFPTRSLSITLFMASALTHPPLWLVLSPLRKAWGVSYQDYVLYGEIAVCLTEGLWYTLMLPPRGRAFIQAITLSLYLNSVSYLIGLYL